MRILLIDDEPGVVRALELLLKAIGHEPRTFTNPCEALDSLKSDATYDLILCDLRMEPLSGFDVLSSMSCDYPKLPFVLISGHATSQDVEFAKAQGAVGFLGKPFQPAEFNSLLSKLQQEGHLPQTDDQKLGNA